MTLLITLIAAVVTSVIWYTSPKARELKTGVLLYMFWGASLMWLVDSVVEYIEAPAEFFAPAASDMINDSYLGLSVVALGLIIWLIVLLVKDPDGKIRAALAHK